jgi:hypothetical protein
MIRFSLSFTASLLATLVAVASVHVAQAAGVPANIGVHLIFVQ